MNTLATRVFEARNRLGITQTELGKLSGVSQNAIQKIESGQTKEPKNLLNLAEALNVEPKWLQTGQGEMSVVGLETTEAENSIVIDVLDVEASAGNGSTGDLVEVVSKLYYVPEQFHLYFRGMNPDNIRVINIRGDSMTPTFSSGDMIFVDIGVTCFDGDGVYVFTYKENLYVKRLQMAGDELIVISDNPTYREWNINEENFEFLHIQGKVKVHQSQRLNFIG